MKVALIGASGFVGSALLEELLERGHEVTAVARHPEKIAASEHLSVVKADVLNEEEVAQAVIGNDAVISAYNAGWSNPDLYEEFLKGSAAIQTGIEKAGIKRLIVIGGAGSLYISPELQLVDSEGFPDAIKPGALAARDYLTQLRAEKDLEWTYLSPAPGMHPGSSRLKKGTYRIGLENPVFDENHKSEISVGDLALAVVDELESPKHLGQRFTVGY